MNSTESKLEENAKEVAQVLKLLSNHQRLLVLCCISEGEMTVGQLNQSVDLSQSALSQHLAKLRNSELVATRRVSQTIYYRIKDPKIATLLKFLQDNFCPDI
ncbi:MAG: ArsR/SmtB family transcription factor [Colwellia sp.]